MSGVVCDLDGVVYRGRTAIPGADKALRALEEAGHSLLFLTNNSARPPEYVAEKLATVVGYRATREQVITSALAAAGMIEAGPVLIMGELGIEQAVRARGWELTDDPSAAATVVVGLDRGLSYERVAAAADAVRMGARLIVTNRDPTFPIEDVLKPGAGACAAAVESAAGLVGETACKPSPALRAFVEERIPEGTIWMIGDRADTDIALASGERWRSILVLTGVTEPDSEPSHRPDAVVADLPAAARLILDESV